MKLIAGLGNPGKEYNLTRHNLGFRILDAFKKELGFPAFKATKKLRSAISTNTLYKQRIILAKPQTLMNSSGKALRLLLDYYKLETKETMVVHDDIDLELGAIRIVKNKGPAGHKGVQSIIKELGTEDFLRLRVGIGPQSSSSPVKRKEFVLSRFTKEEEKIIKKAIKESVKALETYLSQGLDKAMNEFN